MLTGCCSGLWWKKRVIEESREKRWSTHHARTEPQRSYLTLRASRWHELGDLWQRLYELSNMWWRQCKINDLWRWRGGGVAVISTRTMDKLLGHETWKLCVCCHCYENQICVSLSLFLVCVAASLYDYFLFFPYKDGSGYVGSTFLNPPPDPYCSGYFFFFQIDWTHGLDPNPV